jgi:hypothetical protein
VGEPPLKLAVDAAREFRDNGNHPAPNEYGHGPSITAATP